MMELINALHLREPWEALKARTIPQHQNSYWYYLGGLTLFCLLIQVVTGILLACYYRPTPEAAHQSLIEVVTRVPFGEVIRSVHAWCANVLIALILLHMLSVFFLRAYRSPRAILWYTGLVLLLLVLAFGFTGYLLPWDPTAYFATRIGAGLLREVPIFGNLLTSWVLGSKEVTGSTLTRLYALHLAILPLFALVLAATHVTIASLLGRAVPATAKIKAETRFIPDYLFGEAIIWLIGLAVLLTIAVLFPWPLGPAYDLTKPSAPASGVHPAWYFMFLYQTLKYLPNWATVYLYLLVLVFWISVPWLDRKLISTKEDGEREGWFLTAIGIILIAGFAFLTVLAYLSIT